MIVELGHYALILALCVSAVLATLPLVGAQRGDAGWMALARPAAWAQCVLVALAYAALTQAFVTHDYSVAYVAQHSNSALPLAYRIAAVWGGHEGSILLWALMLAGWTAAVAARSRALDLPSVARILAIMGAINLGILLFTLLTSNPFERLLPAPPDGRDLNPLLQDPGMVLHPPLLYMGYVGFVVPFAFAVAALLAGRLDEAWARWSRPWTLLAWSFLTLGIALGSYWAYYELGWGGWWFWDPVENASFMPWLVGTALLHSLIVTEQRGGFRMWTALLAILTFSLSLLGTFLVRSGVVTSVHAFATDPTRGVFILGFLVLVVGGSLTLYAWRAPRIGAGERFSVLSRESSLLVNNLLLLVATAAVLLGTLYPLVLDALGLGQLSVGPPYFEAVFVPLIAPALFLMGIGPLAAWRHADPMPVARRLRWAVGVSLASALLAPWVLGAWTPWIGFGLLLAAWVATSTATSAVVRARTQAPLTWPARYWGMLAAHGGVAVFIVGVTLVGGLEVERDVQLRPGASATVAGHDYRLIDVREVLGPNYLALRATLSVTRDGAPVATMRPERRIYPVSGMALTETAIHSRWNRDLYVSMGEPVGDEAWSLRIHHKPFVVWIWAGCLLMALGGLLAVADRRYRVRQPDASAAQLRGAQALAKGSRRAGRKEAAA